MKEFVHPTTMSHVEFEFEKFKTKHGKNYETQLELASRKEVFRQNLRFIHSVNRQQKGTPLYKLFTRKMKFSGKYKVITPLYIPFP